MLLLQTKNLKTHLLTILDLEIHKQIYTLSRKLLQVTGEYG